VKLEVQALKVFLLSSRLSLFSQIIWNLNHAVNGKKFFGQTGEDAILQLLLKEKKGFYLDIGAGNPIKASNTYFFYKKGWSGIAIDPIETNSKMFRLLRRRDQFIQKIVSMGIVDLHFWEFTPNEYSTSNKEVAQEIIEKNLGKLSKIYIVQALKISDLRLKCTPLEPTLLSIDVEGMDLDVLKSNNWNEFLPRVIAIEDWDRATESDTDIGNYLKEKLYIQYAWTNLTSIFVHQEYLNELNLKVK
jgi:FkbM family methyltransferase